MTWQGRPGRRTRREVLATALVLAGLVGFVALTYAAVVLGGGALIGATPSVVLSVLATALVALAFAPVQRRLAALAARAVHGGVPSPSEVLRDLSRALTGTFAAEELPSRIAHVLADGTGATWTQVWLLVDRRPRLAATWPPSAARNLPTWPLEPRLHPDVRVLPVRHRGEHLGLLVLHQASGLTPVEERLAEGLADQAGLVLRSAGLRAELADRAQDLSRRAEELRASLQRLVELQDEKRRLLERDIHDGAQQHLVALAANLGLARVLARSEPSRSAAQLSTQVPAVQDAIEVLTRLAHGIYPPLLEDHGLLAALRSATERSPIPVLLEARGVVRYSPETEAAAYFCCLEAVQNAVKHADASVILVLLEHDDGDLSCTVLDDGTGIGTDPETPTNGTGLAGMRDRVESVGGSVTARPVAGGGTGIRVRLPSRAVAPSGAGGG